MEFSFHPTEGNLPQSILLIDRLLLFSFTKLYKYTKNSDVWFPGFGMKPFEIIYEDNHLLVVNKAAGILVQGDSTGDAPLVDLCKQYIGEKHNKPGAVFLGVVHRLDRPVSGVVVF